MENSDDEYERPDVIIDNGSSYMKCGLGGEEGPRAVIRSCVGYPKKYSGFGGSKLDFYIGEDIKSKEGLLNYNYPIIKKLHKFKHNLFLKINLIKFIN